MRINIQFFAQYKYSLSQEWLPRELVLRWQLDANKHAVALFGAYCQVYAEPEDRKMNTMAERTIYVINLGLTGNFQGTHKFPNLNTGQVIKQRSFLELPMPDKVIKQVKKLADKDKQSRNMRLRIRRNELYTWNNDKEIEDLEATLIEDNAPEPKVAAVPFPGILTEMPGMDLQREATTPAIIEPEPSNKEQAMATRNNTNFGRMEQDIVVIIGQGELDVC